MKVLFLILARGGSKGILSKNMRRICGISLIGFKAISAKKSRFCTRLMISTDSESIQEEARRYHVEVPFTRPSELSDDHAQADNAVLHAMRFVEEEGRGPMDAVMMLQPTSPFATAEDYDRAVELMVRERASLVVGMRRVSVPSIFQGPLGRQGHITAIIDKMSGLRDVNRQSIAPEFTMNGAFFLIKWDHFREHKRRYCDRIGSFGLVMPDERSIDIDTPRDLLYAEYLAEKGIVDLTPWKMDAGGGGQPC